MHQSISKIFKLFLVLFLISCQAKRNNETVIRTDQISDPFIELVKVDSVKSIVTWIGSKPGERHNGTIGIKSGLIGIRNDSLVFGTIDIEIQSIKLNNLIADTTNYAWLKSFLISKDFFDVDSFPTAHFQLSKILAFDSAKITYDSVGEPNIFAPAPLEEFIIPDVNKIIIGNLMMKGITREITIPAKLTKVNNRLIIEARFNINRTDWGLSYKDESTFSQETGDDFIYNSVNIGFYLITI